MKFLIRVFLLVSFLIPYYFFWPPPSYASHCPYSISPIVIPPHGSFTINISHLSVNETYVITYDASSYITLFTADSSGEFLVTVGVDQIFGSGSAQATSGSFEVGITNGHALGHPDLVVCSPLGSSTVTVDPSLAPPTCVIDPSFSTVTSGTPLTLTLIGSNATSCSSTNLPGCSGAGLICSSAVPTTTPGTYTYTAVCTNSSGATGSCSATVNVTAPVTNTLNVTSNISSVPITGSQSGTGGTTNYTVTMSGTDINTTLTAPLTSGGRTFLNWSGCNSAGNQCFAQVSGGATYTVTANYSAPVTNTLNVTSNISSVPITGSQSGTGGTTNYTVTMSGTDINTTLTAPLTSGGRTFLNWSGCNSAGNQCFAQVSGGATYTVTANYSALLAPPPPPPPVGICNDSDGDRADARSVLFTSLTIGKRGTCTSPASPGGVTDGCFGGMLREFFCDTVSNECLDRIDVCPAGTTLDCTRGECVLSGGVPPPPPPPPPPPGPGPGPLPPGTPAGPSQCALKGEPFQISCIVEIIERIIKVLASAAGIAFFLMMLMGAFRYIKSAGDPKKIASARDTLKYALIGAIFVAAAWLILVVIKQFTGVDVTTVSIP